MFSDIFAIYQLFFIRVDFLIKKILYKKIFGTKTHNSYREISKLFQKPFKYSGKILRG